MPAALTLALAAALSIGAYAGDVVLLLAVLLVQGLVASGWHRALAVPGALGAMVLAASTAVAADVLLMLRDDARPLTPVAGVLGLAMLGAFVHQLARGPDRARLTASLTATTALVVLVALASLLLAVDGTRGGASLVTLAALAAAVAAAADLFTLPELVSAGVAIAGGTIVGAFVGAVTDLGVGSSLVLGGAVAATAVAATSLVRRAERPDLATAAAMPLVVAAPVAYVLGRLLVG